MADSDEETRDAAAAVEEVDAAEEEVEFTCVSPAVPRVM